MHLKPAVSGICKSAGDTAELTELLNLVEDWRGDYSRNALSAALRRFIYKNAQWTAGLSATAPRGDICPCFFRSRKLLQLFHSLDEAPHHIVLKALLCRQLQTDRNIQTREQVF